MFRVQGFWFSKGLGFIVQGLGWGSSTGETRATKAAHDVTEDSSKHPLHKQ